VVIQGVVFDMDDTLYFERDYVRSGFAHVARLLSSSEADAAAIHHWLEAAFDRGVRGDTFDQLLAARPDLARRAAVPDLVSAYRSHVPTVTLADNVRAVLHGLKAAGYRLGLLTDGAMASQAAKVAALELERWLDPIILTEALGSAAIKPGAAAFEHVAQTWDIPHRDLAYVADNPAKDFLAPNRLGWLSIRIRSPEQLRATFEPPSVGHAAAIEIMSLDELAAVLRRSKVR
jgi:putative hydrolase of the HAD superfamily